MSALDQQKKKEEEEDSASEEEAVVEEEAAVEEEAEKDLSDSDVCTKYQEAAKIANKALEFLVSQAVAGAAIIDLCTSGEAIITAMSSNIYNKKVKGVMPEKGVAFPVCISVNECVGNNSPLKSEEQAPLAVGDVVKIDLGCHIDGFIAVAAHTLIVTESADTAPTEVDAELSDVAVATYNAMRVATASIRAGGKNTDVTAAVMRVAEAYGVAPLVSVRMHQMKRFCLDHGKKEIALKTPTGEDAGDKVAECEFEANEVYAVDVAMSSGEGKPRQGEARTTIFKTNVENKYQLRMRASRVFFSEVNKKFQTFPFSLRSFDDERAARMGVKEPVDHELLTPYPVCYERPGVKVAHFKCTVLVLPSGGSIVTGLSLPSYFTSEKVCDDESATILTALDEAKAKKDKKKAAKKNKKKAKA